MALSGRSTRTVRMAVRLSFSTSRQYSNALRECEVNGEEGQEDH